MGSSCLVANEAFSLKSASVWWATVTYGRVGKLKTRVGKRIFFSALRAEFCPPWPETLPAPLNAHITEMVNLHIAIREQTRC